MTSGLRSLSNKWSHRAGFRVSATGICVLLQPCHCPCRTPLPRKSLQSSKHPIPFVTVTMSRPGSRRTTHGPWCPWCHIPRDRLRVPQESKDILLERILMRLSSDLVLDGQEMKRSQRRRGRVREHMGVFKNYFGGGKWYIEISKLKISTHPLDNQILNLLFFFYNFHFFSEYDFISIWCCVSSTEYNWQDFIQTWPAWELMIISRDLPMSENKMFNNL